MANLKFQNAIHRKAQAVPPVWFMRQAGRYHRHYQALRAKHSFEEMCKTPDLAAEVAMGPIRDFDFDVAILFSDILFPLEALGMGLKYDPAPTLGFHLDRESIKKLKTPNEAIEHMRFQKQAMIETRKVLPADKSLIGFIGGPWTLFVYAVEGSHKGGLEKSKKRLSMYPAFCEIMLPLLEQNIRLQIDGGAEVVMVFDTAAGELSPGVYRDLIVPSLEKLARAFPGRLGSYSKMTGESHLAHPIFSEEGLWAGIGVDHRWEMPWVLTKRKTGFVQGNFDQSLLFLEPSEFKTQAEKYLRPLSELSLEQRAGWVAGLGHGVLPGTPEENVRRYVQLVREVMTK